MGWFPVFVDEVDAPQLLDWLNREEDIAFILPEGPKRWKAVHTVPGLKDGCHALWHVPSGPLVRVKKYGIAVPIANPWRGWKEWQTGADRSKPWFGTVYTAVFWLRLHTRHRQDLLQLSGVEWIGNHFAPAGYRASPLAVKWWRRLKRWVASSSTRLRAGRWSFWAFPSALAKLKGGMRYWVGGLDLSETLRDARG